MPIQFGKFITKDQLVTGLEKLGTETPPFELALKEGNCQGPPKQGHMEKRGKGKNKKPPYDQVLKGTKPGPPVKRKTPEEEAAMTLTSEEDAVTAGVVPPATSEEAEAAKKKKTLGMVLKYNPHHGADGRFTSGGGGGGSYKEGDHVVVTGGGHRVQAHHGSPATALITPGTHGRYVRDAGGGFHVVDTGHYQSATVRGDQLQPASPDYIARHNVIARAMAPVTTMTSGGKVSGQVSPHPGETSLATDHGGGTPKYVAPYAIRTGHTGSIKNGTPTKRSTFS